MGCADQVSIEEAEVPSKCRRCHVAVEQIKRKTAEPVASGFCNCVSFRYRTGVHLDNPVEVAVITSL